MRTIDFWVGNGLLSGWYAVFYLAAKPLVTLGALGYLLIAAALVAFTSDWVLALLGVFFAAFAVANARPMTTDITSRVVEGAAGTDEPGDAE